mgnify:FL=1
MTWKRKYIDLPTVLCDRLAVVCVQTRITQRKFIEDAVTAAIDVHEKAASKSAKRAARSK